MYIHISHHRAYLKCSPINRQHLQPISRALASESNDSTERMLVVGVEDWALVGESNVYARVIILCNCISSVANAYV